jgi:hypothetical protein
MLKGHGELNYVLLITRNSKRDLRTLERLSSGVITSKFYFVKAVFPFSFNLNASNRLIIINPAPI